MAYFDKFEGRLIRITRCDCTLAEYSHIKPKSIHTIVKPPANMINHTDRVFVKGKTDIAQPVEIESGEFEFYDKPLGVRKEKYRKKTEEDLNSFLDWYAKFNKDEDLIYMKEEIIKKYFIHLDAESRKRKKE